MESKRDWKGLAWLALAAAGVLLLLQGCAGLDYVGQRIGDRAERLAEDYCGLPKTVRLVARVEANKALTDTATIVVGCPDDDDYESLRVHYVEPFADRSLDALVIEALERRGTYELPDGRVLRLVVDSPEGE